MLRVKLSRLSNISAFQHDAGYWLITFRRAFGMLLLSLSAIAAWDGFSSSGYARGAAAYLDRPAHAHGAALGKAVTAWYRDLAGTQYNPALLDAAESVQLVGSYTFLTDDRRFIAAEATIPVGQYIVAGILFRNMTVGGIEQRDEYGFLDGHFDDRENALGLAVAGRMPLDISIGIRARYLGQEFEGIDKGRAYGMGFDAGALWRPHSMISVGVSGLNIGSYLWWKTGHRDVVLPQARVGVAGSFLEQSLNVGFDVARAIKQPLEVSGGVEYILFHIVSARVGINTSVDLEDRHSRDPDISGGIGVRYNFFGCDYAITIPTEHTREMMSHTISLLLRFKPPQVL